MFGMFTVKTLTPAQVRAGQDKGDIVLIDVREPGEFRSERIGGSVNIPLSTLADAALPDPAGKTIVMQCAAGSRSAQAVNICRKRGLPVEHHLAGGIGAWKSAGFPTIR